MCLFRSPVPLISLQLVYSFNSWMFSSHSNTIGPGRSQLLHQSDVLSHELDLGRKRCILSGTAIMVIGTILQVSSYSLAQMFVGRVVLG